MILCDIQIGEQPPEIVRVRDLSECGIRIAITKALTIGDRMRVRLPGTSAWCLARVAWQAKGTAGLAFAHAVDLPGVSGANRPSPTHESSARDYSLMTTR